MTLPQMVLAAPNEDGNPHNGLSSQAFLYNSILANEQSLHILRNHQLSEIFSAENGHIAHELKDPRNKAVMAEIVKCALAAGTTLEHDVDVWEGELGLCQHDQATGDSEHNPSNWNQDKPNRVCQELVTACLMARVNSLGKSIPLSLRSESPTLASLHKQVSTDKRFRENYKGEDPSEGSPIRSFDMTGSACARGDECNWVSANVGTCSPGEIMQLAIRDPSACKTTMLRVCGGIHGCAPSNPRHDLISPLKPLRPYSKFLDQTWHCPRLQFTCPTEPQIAGYYSVMIWQALAGSPKSIEPTVIKAAGSGMYPAAEEKVFPFAEGAFYGNLFEPQPLRRRCKVNEDGTTLECSGKLDAPPAVVDPDVHSARNDSISCSSKPGGGSCFEDNPFLPYKNIYACYTFAQEAENEDDDKLSVAALNSRLCNKQDATDCFPVAPRRCHYNKTAQKKGPCGPMGPDGAYGYCKGQIGEPTGYKNIITTYLNDPCDLIRNPDLCARIRKTIIPIVQGSGGTTKIAPSPHGCGRCSVDGAGGAIQPALLAALVALLLHRRRRHSGD